MSEESITPWKFATAVLAVFLTTTAAMWGMITAHAESPHRNAVQQREFDTQNVYINQRLERIESKLDTILSR